MRYQILTSIGDGPMQQGRIFENMGEDAARAILEFKEAIAWEEIAAQQSANYTRQKVCLEVRDLEKGYLIAHKSFTPMDLMQ